VSTPNGKSVIHTNFPYYIGNYGFCSANGAVEYVENEQFDCLLILGSSLGQTATFIAIPVLKDYYEFTNDNKEKYESIIKKYNDQIVELNLLSITKLLIQQNKCYIELKKHLGYYQY